MLGAEPDSGSARQSPHGSLGFGGLLLNLDSCTLLRELGEAIPLTRGEFALLRVFVRRPGRVVSRDTLLGAVSNRNLEPFDRSVDALVCRLRRKIEADPKTPQLIVTVPGEGYRFDGLKASVREPPAPLDTISRSACAATPNARESETSSRPANVTSRKLTAIGAVLLALVAAGALAWRQLGAADDDKLAPPPGLSIVVLPFENLSGSSDQDYVADGIADDLTTDLARLPDSSLVARKTAFAYKGKSIDAKQIGIDLNVRYIVEGSLRRVGDMIAVNAELVSAETGAELWADRFEGQLKDLGELRLAFAPAIANSLGLELVKAESLRAERERPDDPNSLDHVLRGEALLQSKRSQASLAEAINHFERALALDPTNVRAMRNLAAGLVIRKNQRWSEDPKGDLLRAEDLIDAALAIRPLDSSNHQVKGMVLIAQKKWRAAMAEAETAIAQDPNNARAYADIGVLSLFIDRSKDGLASIEKAFQLSPRDPARPTWHTFACYLHLSLAEWSQAIDSCNRSLAGRPDRWRSLVGLAAASAWIGNDRDAKDALARLQKLRPELSVQMWMREEWPDDPTAERRWAGVAEGLRRAGLPDQ